MGDEILRSFLLTKSSCRPMYNLRMVREDDSALRVVRLKAESVMCQVGTCTDKAKFLVKQRNGLVRAVCEKHLKAMGLEPPPQALQ